MKILLSAYACEPGRGSEPGVGWHWAIELARLGHEVAVITRSNNRFVIEKALADAPIASLRFYYCDLPRWATWWKRGNRGVYFYYWLWQHAAYRLAKHLTKTTQFDLVHHLTFTVFRQASYMGRLGLPFVVGPFGGGEVAPALLRRALPLKAAIKERFRDVLNKLALLNPSLRTMLMQATVIFVKTPETLAALPMASRGKCRLQMEVGVEPERIKAQTFWTPTNVAFFYAGRLLCWKGLHLALRAFAELHKERPDSTFTIAGDGTDSGLLKELADTLGLRNCVHWLGNIPHEQLRRYYNGHTAFVFPSLHDSGGTVILEALSQALPVICLDAGGPGEILLPSCGVKVSVENRSEEEVVADLKTAMRMLADNPELRARMGRRALEFATECTWKKVVSGAYAHIEQSIGKARNMPIKPSE